MIINQAKLKTENSNEIKFSTIFSKNIINKEVPITVKRIDPKAPDIVLLGLMLVNLGPPINLPTTYPPISEKIHVINKINIIHSLNSIFNFIKKK